jgi:hypothetical protein
MNPALVAAVIAAGVSVLTLIGTLASQYFGRRVTSRDTESRVRAVQPDAGRPGVPESGLTGKSHHPRITGLKIDSYWAWSLPLTSA